MRLSFGSIIPACAFVFLCGAGVGACAVQPKAVAQEQMLRARTLPIRVVSPKNLSGRPLRQLEASLYTADALALSEALGPRPSCDFLALLQQALEHCLVERGYVIAVDGEPALEVHCALTEWETPESSQPGLLLVSVRCCGVVTGSEEPVFDAECQARFALLEYAAHDEVVLGARRVIAGRIDELAISLGWEMLRVAGMVEPGYNGPVGENLR